MINNLSYDQIHDALTEANIEYGELLEQHQAMPDQEVTVKLAIIDNKMTIMKKWLRAAAEQERYYSRDAEM